MLILKDFKPIRINTYRQGYIYPLHNQHLQETWGWGVYPGISLQNRVELFQIGVKQLLQLDNAFLSL